MNISATPSRSSRKPALGPPGAPEAERPGVPGLGPVEVLALQHRLSDSIRTAQPRIRLMSSTAIVPELRKKQTRIASPIAASAAATVRMNSTKTWPTRSPR